MNSALALTEHGTAMRAAPIHHAQTAQYANGEEEYGQTYATAAELCLYVTDAAGGTVSQRGAYRQARCRHDQGMRGRGLRLLGVLRCGYVGTGWRYTPLTLRGRRVRRVETNTWGIIWGVG